jgi:predicted nucleotidyltransferase
MINIFVEEHRQILFALIKHKVDFIIIGGYAVIHYGYDRNTGDMDIWLQTGNENRDKLLNALRDFGIIDEHLETLKKMDFTNPVTVFYFGEIPRKIEFITLISNVKFENAIQHVNYFPLENEKIPVIHYNDLILSKLTSTRLKDKADIEELERINKYRKGK